jgi:hypothetical protein
MVFYHGKFGGHWRVVFEFALPKGLDAAIRRFARLLDGLTGPARTAWKRAQGKVFDIGIQSGHESHPLELNVQAFLSRGHCGGNRNPAADGCVGRFETGEGGFGVVRERVLAVRDAEKPAAVERCRIQGRPVLCGGEGVWLGPAAKQLD